MPNQTTGWRSDPYGAHELRFFAADGTPTLLVMDGGETSYHRPPMAEPSPASEPVTSPPEEEPSAPGPTSSPAPSPTGADSGPVESARVGSDGGSEHGRPKSPIRPRKLAYAAVVTALVLSGLGLAYVQFLRTGTRHSGPALGATTTAPARRTTTTTTIIVPVPSALKPDAESAATALVSSWSTGNRAEALTVATPSAVAALFAVRYPTGLAEDRGCSTSFMPIVCTFGPPGGADPNDPIYEIYVLQAPGGWYVSSVKV